MGLFILPFVETNRGWYEIEADSIEDAKKIASDASEMMDYEPFYKDGDVVWDEEEIYEDK